MYKNGTASWNHTCIKIHKYMSACIVTETNNTTRSDSNYQYYILMYIVKATVAFGLTSIFSYKYLRFDSKTQIHNIVLYPWQQIIKWYTFMVSKINNCMYVYGSLVSHMGEYRTCWKATSHALEFWTEQL